tara:strand:+ start:412 stop:810 length:399 start_codon:yes stop_codon:yes gene_type:complete
LKLLKYYTQDKIDKTIKNNGGFFAFNNKQFNENKKEGVIYCSLYGGLIVPKNKADYILKQIDLISKKAIKQDIKENGIKNIIFRDCSNLELQFSYNGIEEIIDYLKDYNFNKKDIEKYYNKYIKHCIKNDLI